MESLQRLALIGDDLPRPCGIVTFTTDLPTTVTAEHPRPQCFVVPVKDIRDGYEYPDVVRFEIEQQRRVMEEVLIRNPAVGEAGMWIDWKTRTTC